MTQIRNTSIFILTIDFYSGHSAIRRSPARVAARKKRGRDARLACPSPGILGCTTWVVANYKSKIAHLLAKTHDKETRNTWGRGLSDFKWWGPYGADGDLPRGVTGSAHQRYRDQRRSRRANSSPLIRMARLARRCWRSTFLSLTLACGLTMEVWLRTLGRWPHDGPNCTDMSLADVLCYWVGLPAPLIYPR